MAAGFALVFSYLLDVSRPADRCGWRTFSSGPNTAAAAWGGSFSHALAALAVERKCGRFEWAVLDWNAPAIRVLRVARRVAAARLADRAGDGRCAAATRCGRHGRLQPTLGISDASISPLLDRCRTRRDGLDADFWSLRFVEETCESFSVRRNVQQPWAVIDRPRRHGDRLCGRRLWLCRHRRHVAARLARRAAARRGVGARHRAPRADRFADAAAPGAARRVRLAVARRGRCRRAATGTSCCSASRSEAGLRSAHRRLGSARRRAAGDAPPLTSEGGDVVQRLSLPVSVDQRHRACRRRHAAALAERPARHLPAGRRRDPRPLRLRRQRPARRRRSAGAARGAELPVGHDGRAAGARPDGAADPRVDRTSARARPHPRRRAQFRRHELRHAGHVRHATATAPSC